MLTKRELYRIRELRQEISNLEFQKQQAIREINSIYKEYLLNRISFEDYKNKIKKLLENKTEKEFFEEIENKIRKINNRIKSIEQQTRITTITLLAIPIILFLFLSFTALKPRITGFTVYNESFEKSNITETQQQEIIAQQELTEQITQEQLKNESVETIKSAESEIRDEVQSNISSDGILDSITEFLDNKTIENISETENITIKENISEEITEEISINISEIKEETKEIEILENITENITLNISAENITIENISIENITNRAPELIKEIPNITIKQNEIITINLSEYFYDYDNDTLIFTAAKPENISLEIIGEIVTIKAENNFYGKQKIVFIASDLKDVSYSNEVIITVLPEIENTIPKCYFIELELLESEEKTIDLNDYCFDEENDTLIYNITQIKNIAFYLNNSLLKIVAEKQGNYEIPFMVSDGKNTTTYLIKINISKAKIIEELTQLPAEIRKPVVWVKRLTINSNKNITITTQIPEQAFNITVEKETKIEKFEQGTLKTEKLLEKISDEEVIVRVKGITRTLKDEKILRKEIKEETKEEVKITGMAVLTTQNINYNKIIKQTIIALKNLLINIINFFRTVFRITGFVVYSEQENMSLSFNAEPTNYIITYNTKAPEVKEQEIITDTKWNKKVIVSSELHYNNITAYTEIIETENSRIHLYEITDDSKIEITNNKDYEVEFIDTNNNSLIDKVIWKIPHLSNKSYEVEVDLIILNVQSYPMVMGNWTVAFNTSGSADLKITAINETTYSEKSIDYNETIDDLEFLEIKCGEEIINDLVYIIPEQNISECINSTLNYNSTQTNISCELHNETILVSYREILQQEISIITKSIFIKNFSCDNKTSYLTVKVLTPGVHTQEFNFGGIIKHAHNLAGAPTIILESPINNTILHTGTILNFTIIDDNLNQTWYSKDNGLTNITLEEPWDINTSTWTEGSYNITIWASDNDTNIKSEKYYFVFNNSAYGILSVRLIWPSDFANTSVYKYSTFNFKVEVICSEGPCGDVNATLDPITIRRMVEEELIREKNKKEQELNNKGVGNE
ncbi:MAG: hypothetical protein QXU20_03620 [Candidatus Woesearchaeota archaeon]